MSDASPLLVPITCEALVVNDLVRTGERWLRLTMAYADLTNPPGTATPRDPSQADPLFTAQPGTDVAPGITSSQFYNGVYLKWRLPPALLRGVVDNRTGETRFPLIIQNTHRYFFYIAAVISVINTYDAILAFRSPTGFGFGLGNIVLLVNVVMLWVYTLSCHSCRHVAGGRLKHFSKHPVRYWMWTQISKLNTRHKLYAWITLGTLMFTDFYIMALAAGWFSDLRFIG